MFAKRNESEDNRDLKLLDNLKEDLRVLEMSWQNKNLHSERVIRLFVEIIDSIAEVVRTEPIRAAEVVCGDLKEHLASVADGKASLGERSWRTAAELIDLMSDSLGGAAESTEGLEELQTRWTEENLSHEQAGTGTVTEPGGPVEKSADMRGEVETPNSEERTMNDTNAVDPKELLQQAQEALLSGNGESAKEMALRAAEIIAQGEAEEIKKREQVLIVDLENIAQEESEAEQAIDLTKGQISEREDELNSLTERLSEAQAAFDERDAACKELREQLDETEAEMAAIKEKHKQLLDRFQEVLPARDAAERERAKIKGEYGELPSEIEILRDNLQNLEHQLERIRERKAESETELEKMAERTSV